MPNKQPNKANKFLATNNYKKTTKKFPTVQSVRQQTNIKLSFPPVLVRPFTRTFTLRHAKFSSINPRYRTSVFSPLVYKCASTVCRLRTQRRNHKGLATFRIFARRQSRIARHALYNCTKQDKQNYAYPYFSMDLAVVQRHNLVKRKNSRRRPSRRKLRRWEHRRNRAACESLCVRTFRSKLRLWTHRSAALNTGAFNQPALITRQPANYIQARKLKYIKFAGVIRLQHNYRDKIIYRRLGRTRQVQKNAWPRQQLIAVSHTRSLYARHIARLAVARKHRTWWARQHPRKRNTRPFSSPTRRKLRQQILASAHAVKRQHQYFSRRFAGRRHYLADRFLSIPTVTGRTSYARHARLVRARSIKSYQGQLAQTVFSSRTVSATHALLRYVPRASLGLVVDASTQRTLVQARPAVAIKTVLLSPSKHELLGEQYKKENEKYFAASGAYTKKFSTSLRNKICAAQRRPLVSAIRKPGTLAPSAQRFAHWRRSTQAACSLRTNLLPRCILHENRTRSKQYRKVYRKLDIAGVSLLAARRTAICLSHQAKHARTYSWLRRRLQRFARAYQRGYSQKTWRVRAAKRKLKNIFKFNFRLAAHIRKQFVVQLHTQNRLVGRVASCKKRRLKTTRCSFFLKSQAGFVFRPRQKLFDRYKFVYHSRVVTLLRTGRAQPSRFFTNRWISRTCAASTSQQSTPAYRSARTLMVANKLPLSLQLFYARLSALDALRADSVISFSPNL